MTTGDQSSRGAAGLQRRPHWHGIRCFFSDFRNYADQETINVQKGLILHS